MKQSDGDDYTTLNLSTEKYFSARMVGGFPVIEGLSECQIGAPVSDGNSGFTSGTVVSWKWEAGSLRIHSDRYGMIPLFIYSSSTQVSISTNFSTLVRLIPDTRLDYEALGVLFRYGHFIGDDTPLISVKLFPANSVGIWHTGTLNFENHPDTPAEGDYPSISFGDAVLEYKRLFRRAIERRQPRAERFTVPISGGRDSRHILLELNAQGYRPRICPTVEYRPPATNEDARIGRLLSDKLGIGHVRLNRPLSWFEACQKDIHLTNFCGGGHAWILPLAAYLSRHADETYDGLAGDVLSAGHMINREKCLLYKEGRTDKLAETLVSESQRAGFANRALSASFSKLAPLESTIERVKNALDMHSGQRNPLQSFLFWNRTRRAITSIPHSILSHVPIVHTPFLDVDLVEFLLSINQEYLLGGRLHDATIALSYPEFNHIPYEDKSIQPKWSDADREYYRAAIRRFFAYQILNSLSESKILRSWLVLTRSAADLLNMTPGLPWYMMTTMYINELEKLLNSR